MAERKVSRGRHACRSGFTLLEVLLAMSMGLVVVSSLVSVGRLTQRVMLHFDEQMAEARDRRTVRRLFTAYIRFAGASRDGLSLAPDLSKSGTDGGNKSNGEPVQQLFGGAVRICRDAEVTEEGQCGCRKQTAADSLMLVDRATQPRRRDGSARPTRTGKSGRFGTSVKRGRTVNSVESVRSVKSVKSVKPGKSLRSARADGSSSAAAPSLRTLMVRNKATGLSTLYVRAPAWHGLQPVVDNVGTMRVDVVARGSLHALSDTTALDPRDIVGVSVSVDGVGKSTRPARATRTGPTMADHPRPVARLEAGGMHRTDERGGASDGDSGMAPPWRVDLHIAPRNDAAVGARFLDRSGGNGRLPTDGVPSWIQP
ncbi:prepilin-type N-terminal cleavage/methylation domain-containing protein [Chitinasiproducens palmae]|uniref:Prepilin-type N-terminal cleavage/methylation domain-containing protein n=1 Tax=Chitinasiproducens palmae TaxID=1770053 RepID=A0A1H2PSX0_9BURK|nr:prepilin-type N-terminal cleavage/methylation domain-containing protein [Chitinasiproducens palmae]SDV50147.1 prepilin-type N-terminal cleavage/methylation domain-containing protein [Chitinasiproducens palmae]